MTCLLILIDAPHDLVEAHRMQPPPLTGILVLRRYRPEDAKATMAIFYSATGQENCGGFSQKQVEEWVLDFPNRDSWVEGFEEWVTCVAELDGHLIGFSTMMLNGFIAMLYVDPVYQHQNVEVALLTHVEKIALKRGISG